MIDVGSDQAVDEDFSGVGGEGGAEVIKVLYPVYI